MRTLSRVLLVLALSSAFGGCAKVPPGYVGIKVNNYGSQRGVDDYPLQTGMVMYNPITTDVHKYPTFTQQVVWTKDPQEGSPNDESITFNSKEGASINADIAVAYTLNAEKVPHIFVEFRQEVGVLTDGYIRSQVRDAFTRHASAMPVVDVYGAGKQKLLNEVKADINTMLNPRGFIFDMVSFTSALRMDPKVESAISATIEATQKAIEAKNKVAEATARAEQQVAEAKGKAEAMLEQSKAEAESNRVVAQSLTQNPNLLKWRELQNEADAIARWDGKLPQVSGETMPMLNLAPSK